MQNVPLLELEAVTRIYKNGTQSATVLHNIHLTIQSGEMVAVMGRSGSGKSTILNILGCLDRPTSGHYRIAGQDTQSMSPDALAALRCEYFGFIFQRYDLLAQLTAQENVEMPALYSGLNRPAREKRAQMLLTRFGLEDRMDYLPSQLSGGQQQRVSIARALINGGAVILADEPTGALDHASHCDVLEHLRTLHREGHTIIIVTHDPEVAACADRIIDVSDGCIVADRPTLGRDSRHVVPFFPPTKENLTQGARQSLERLYMSLIMAWHMMLSHRLRTVLTVTGVMIGIASVIALIGLGEGTRNRIVTDLRAMGEYTVDIYPGREQGDDDPTMRNVLREADLAVLAAQPFVDVLSPVLYGAGELRYGNKKLNVTTSGTGQSYSRLVNLPMLAGAWFSASNVARRAQVIVIDQNLRVRLFRPEQDPLGEIVLIGQVPFRIVGVAAVRNMLFNNEQSFNAWIPYTTQMAHFVPQDYFNSIKLRLQPQNGILPVSGVERLLQQRHGRRDFFVVTNDSHIQKVEKISSTLTLMVSMIAVISLVVGGVGVMNIMLASVSERIREIGIRMAVGARRIDIQQQFLMEATLLCLTGGLSGVVLAWGGGKVSGWFQDEIVMQLSPAAVLLASVISVTIGISFGFVPARNASGLDPVVALRRE